MDGAFLQALAIGILVMTAVFIGLRRAIDAQNQQVNRAMAVFAAACGVVTAFWLIDNQDFVAEYAREIVIGGIGAVLALLILARRGLR